MEAMVQGVIDYRTAWLSCLHGAFSECAEGRRSPAKSLTSSDAKGSSGRCIISSCNDWAVSYRNVRGFCWVDSEAADNFGVCLTGFCIGIRDGGLGGIIDRHIITMCLHFRLNS